MARTRRESVIGQWREHINIMSNALRDFEQALPGMATDAEFMAAYRHLSGICGDVLDGFRLPIGGTLDDLREAISESQGG